jgi:acyl-CoA synthetase (AMP-forming)/AMP-acid ligase II
MYRSHYLVGVQVACDPTVLGGLTSRGVLAATAGRVPTGVAYVDGTLRLTWAEVAARVDALARALEQAGIGEGDVVGLHLPNSAAFAIAHLAIAEAGAVTLPLHMPYRGAELRQFLAATGAVAYVHARDGDAEFAAIRGSLPVLRSIVAVELDDAIFTIDGSAGALRERPRAIDPEAPFCVVPTSGTESLKPKLCMHAHDGLLSNARAFVDEAGVTSDDVAIVGSGFTHLFGLLGLHLSLVAGATLVALRKFDGPAFLALAEAEGATRAWAVPAQLIDLVAAARSRAPALRLREVRTAGAAVGAEFVRDVRAALRAEVTVHWGMSELGGGITTYGRNLTASPSAIGTPIAGAEVRIARADGSEAAPDEVGELWYRRADMFRGYYADPETTASAVAADGWLRSGDLAARDAAGIVHYHGREKDLVNRGGYKIGAAELEALLHGLSAIRRCAVVAVPDARLGERACLVAELGPGATLTLDEVAAHLDERGVAKYKWPEHLLIVEALPMTATNKIAKSVVRALAAERIAGAVHA